MVGANAMLQRLLTFDLLSLSFFFILPVGAVIGGMGAASGYYLTARWIQRMPSNRLLFNMVAVALSTWLLYHWVSYTTYRFDDGTKLTDIASFWTYLQTSTEHMRLSIGVRGRHLGTTGELGALGYVRQALQVAGFMVGGLAVYGFLTDVEACESYCLKVWK